MPRWLSLGFQDRGSLAIIELSYLHDHVIIIIVRVIILIRYVIIYILVSKYTYKFLSEGTLIETIWSIVPAGLLIILVVPSIKVLYLIEDTEAPSFSVKVLAHQWYWTLEWTLLSCFSFFNNHSIFTDVVDELSMCSYRDRTIYLSDSFVRAFLPVNRTSRLLISSTDVIHAFAIPGLGLKVDAVPGRVNQLLTTPCLSGIYYGQCSEICGANHSFMPIRVNVCSPNVIKLERELFLIDLVSANI